jgi:hypothetical protein
MTRRTMGPIDARATIAKKNLTERLNSLHSQKSRLRMLNRAWRRAGGEPGWSAGLDLTKREVKEMAAAAQLQPDAEGLPFPPFMFARLDQAIRETEKRILEVEHLAGRAMEGPTETTVNDVTIIADPAENRVTIYYPRRLTESELKRTKSFGFSWDPTLRVFTRKMGGTRGAEYAAKMLADGFQPS